MMLQYVAVLQHQRSPRAHKKQLYEKSRLTSDIGAAVHLAPNANGILRRWGLRAEDFGANLVSRFKEIHSSGRVLKDIDLTHANKLWQHPLHGVYRTSLHCALQAAATSEPGVGTGKRAELCTSSQVVRIDPTEGTIELANDSLVRADVLIGADGVYVSSLPYQPPTG
jgi:2-polyprenyl-6-methoxyphenol hydroxylase-like FAD-dependent oxidoreductase